MSSPRTLVVATANANKLREICEVLSDLPVRVTSLKDFDPIESPLETGATFAANAQLKAIYYARATGQWCLADDSGLMVDALDGAPGVLSARYAADENSNEITREEMDAANIARLLKDLASVPSDKRTARFICHLALAKPDRILIETFDTVEGMITEAPRGENGFGYDPVFFILSEGMTAAELTAERKNEISHRGKAVRHFAKLLVNLLRVS